MYRALIDPNSPFEYIGPVRFESCHQVQNVCTSTMQHPHAIIDVAVEDIKCPLLSQRCDDVYVPFVSQNGGSIRGNLLNDGS